MKKLFIIFLIAVSALMSQIPVMAENNLAKDAVVTASQSGSDSTSTPKAVNNGTTSSSTGAEKWFVDKNVSGAWLQFTFANPVTLGGAKVYSGINTAQIPDIAVGFKFQYESEGTWKDVPGGAVSDNEESETEIDFASGVTSTAFRYVSTTETRFRIREIELYQFDPSMAVSSAEVISPDDVKDTKYENAVTKLLSLNLISAEDDGLFYPEYPIKREEFVSWIISCVNTKPEKSGNRIFYDVDPDSETAPAIEEAYRLGLISRDENGNFRPAEEITYDEACVMLVSVLGYRAKAEAAAAYPIGFRETAASLELDKGITLRRDGYLNRGDCAIMIENAIKQQMALLSFSGNTVTYTYEDGGILKRYRKILRTKGIVQATSDTVLYGAAEVRNGQVIVDGEVYNIGNSTVADMLGLNAEIYYKEENDEKTILYAEKTNKNKIMEIDAGEIESAGFDGIIYYQNDRKKTLSFKQGIKFFLNGAESGISENNLLPEYGKYVLIDNNDDGSYDLVMIHSQELSVIKSVDKQNETFSADGRNFDLKSYKNTLIYKDGKRASVGKLAVGNVVSIEESGNKELITVYASTKKLKGEISAVSEDKIKIGDTLYDITTECLKRVKVGQTAKFSLTDNGIIVDFDISASSFKYGYIMGVQEKAGSDDIEMRVLSEDGKISVYVISDNIKVNGDTTPKTAIKVGKLIRFKADADNNIKRIFAEVEAGSREYVENDDNSVVRFDDISKSYYKNGTISLGKNNADRIVGTDTVVFKIPSSDGARDKDYSAEFGTSAVPAGESKGTFRVYNLNSENIPAALVYVTAPKPPLYSSTATAVVSGTAETYDEEDGAVTSLSLYINGKLSDYKTTSDTEYYNEYNTFESDMPNYYKPVTKIEDIKPGDIMQIRTDNDGKISSYRVLFKWDNLDKQGLSQYTGGEGLQATYYPSLETLVATVYNVGKDSVAFDANGRKYTYKKGSPIVYVYNKDRNLLYISDINRLDSEKITGNGTKVFVRVDSKVIKDIVVYE